LTDDLNNTLPALLIGNIITSVLSNKPTNLKKFQVTHQLTGLSDVLASTFAVVPKMLSISGKKFPQNVRAMRLVVEELLRRTI